MGAQLRGWQDGPAARQSLFPLDKLQPGAVLSGYWTKPWELPSAKDHFDISARALGGFGIGNARRELLLEEFPATKERQLVGQEAGLSSDAVVRASGPIVENRLWAFIEASDRQVHGRQPLGATNDQIEWRPRYTLNIGYTPDSKTLVTLGGQYEGVEQSGANESAWTLPSASTLNVTRLGWLSVSLRRQLTDLQEIEAHYGLRSQLQRKSSVNGVDVPGHENLDAEIWSGNAPFETRYERFTHFVDLQWSIFTDGLLVKADAHTFTLGVQLEASSGQQAQVRTGGFTFEDVLPSAAGQLDPTMESHFELSSSVRGDELGLRFRDESLAAYVQDSVRIGSWLAGEMGVRVEHFRGGFVNRLTVWQTTTASPRASLRAFLTEDLRTGLLVQYGRHYRNLDPSMYGRDARGAAVTGVSYWDWDGAPGASFGANPGIDDPGWTLSQRFEPLSGKLASDIRHPYIDRLVFGGFSSLWDDQLKFRLRYELAFFRQQLAIFDRRFYEDGQEAYTLQSVGDPQQPDTESYYRHNLDVPREYVIGNAKGAWRNRHTLELVGQVIPAKWLTMAVRGALTQDVGNLQDDSGLSLEWSDPSGALRSGGRMPGFNRWEVGAAVGWILPAGFEVHGKYSYESGQYYSRRVRLEPQESGSNRMYVFDSAGRGAYRLPPRQKVDGEIDWSVPCPRSAGAFHVIFMAKNLFNSGVPTKIYENDVAFGAVQELEDPLELLLGAAYRY